MSGPAYYTGVINIAKNDDWTVPFLYAAQNADGSTTPIDLTGSTLMMEFRTQDIDHAVLISLSSPNAGITITDAVGGAFTIIIDRDTLSQIAPGDYVSDLVRLMPSGWQERLLDCTVTVAEGVTR
jgi:hypothetical protein